MTDLQETVIMAKGDGLAVLSFYLAPNKGQVLSVNFRDNAKIIKQFNSAKETWKNFESAVETSQDRGWKIVHRGQPNIG